MRHRKPSRSNGKTKSLRKGLEKIRRAGDVSPLFLGFGRDTEKTKETAGSHPPLAWNPPRPLPKSFDRIRNSLFFYSRNRWRRFIDDARTIRGSASLFPFERSRS